MEQRNEDTCIKIIHIVMYAIITIMFLMAMNNFFVWAGELKW